MRKHYIIFALILSLVVSCQKVVDADKLLNTDATVYISSYLSPTDTVLRVTISRVFPSVGTPLSVQNYDANQEKFLIKNAEITISDETGNSINLTYSEEGKSYLADVTTVPILENKNYYLKITIDGEEFNASCHIPERVTMIEESIDVRDSEYGGTEASINLSFQDIRNQQNFYVLGGILSSVYQYEGEEPQEYNYPLYFETNEFLTDALEDGSTLNGTSISYISDGTEVEPVIITLQVANVEEILFQNLKALSTNADADGNPFVEYSIAPSNFIEKNVIGIFAGYSLTEKTIAINL